MALAISTVLVATGPRGALAANYYWNGGTGNWTTNSQWRTPTTASSLTTWVTSNTAIIGNLGSPGTITLNANVTTATGSGNGVNVTASNFVIAPDSTSRTLTGEIALGSNITLGLMAPTETGDRTLNITGSVTGSSGTLNIQGQQGSTNFARVNFNATSANVAGAITINNIGTGVVGFTSAATGVTVAGTVTNNSAGIGSIGATSGFDLTLNGALAGSGTWQFSVGVSGGAGVITLNETATATGTTIVNNNDGGVVKLGKDNALSSGSLQFGTASGPGANANSGSIDLNGKTQAVASLASAGSGSTNGIANTSGSGKLQITGSAVTTYAGSIGTPTTFTNLTGYNQNIALELTSAHTGKLTLTGTSTYTGATTINGGTLAVNGSLASGSAVTASGSGTLGGSGTVRGTVAVNSGGTIAPGNSPGTLTTGAETFAGGGNYAWQLYRADQTAGTGYDTIAVTNVVPANGTLTITATNSNKFNILLESLSALPNTQGTPFVFDANQQYSFTLVSTTGGITGFSADKFFIDTTNFTIGGTPISNSLFSVVLSGNDLVLNFNPVPEPGTVLGVAAAGLGLARVVRRRAFLGSPVFPIRPLAECELST